MDISYFQEFATLAKHGNFSEAARELNITESVLSRHIKTLESELSLELFDRSSTPVRLTALGELFLPFASDAIGAWERIKAFSARYRGKSLLTIRVRGVIDGATLPPLRDAREMVESNDPRVRVKFLPHQFQTPFSDIREGKLDIAIEPLSDLIDTHDLAWLHLAHEQPAIMLESSHPLAGQATFGPSDLAGLKFISLRSNRDNAMRKHVQAICKRHDLTGDIPKALVLSPCDSYEGLFLEGLNGCVLMLPASLAARYAEEFSDDYVVCPFEGEDVNYDWCAFYRKDAPVHVKAYLEALKKYSDDKV